MKKAGKFYLFMSLAFSVSSSAFAGADSIGTVILEEEQKRSVALHLDTQLTSYREPGWDLVKIKNDLTAKLGKSEKWIHDHIITKITLDKKLVNEVKQDQVQHLNDFFKEQKIRVAQYETKEKIIEVHEMSIQELAKDGNFVFEFSRSAFTHRWTDVFALLFTVPLDVVLLPFTLFATLVSCW